VLCGHFERATVGESGLGVAAEASQEVGAGGVEVAVVVERELVDNFERGLGAVDLGDRDCAVHFHDR
jgi:hypothetical protein